MRFPDQFVGQKRRLATILIGCILCLIGAFGLAPSRAQAADFSYQTRVDYVVDDSGVTHVQQSFSVTNNTDRTVLDSVALSTPTDQVSNIHAYYNDGANIPYTTASKTNTIDGYTYHYVEITITFDRSNVGDGLNWGFHVDYDTDKLVENEGSARTVFIPAVGANSITQNYRVRLLVPEDFGHVHAVGVQPHYAGISDNRAIYTFDTNQLTQQSLTLVFGDSTIYHVDFRFPLTNSSTRDTTMTVTLPPDTPSQKVYINKLSPKPLDTHLDADGNVLADYRVPAHTTTTVATDINSVETYLDYNLAKSGTKADIPTNLVKAYTDPMPYWQSTNATVVAKARAAVAVAKAGNNVAKITQALDQFVINTLTYNDAKIKYNIRQGAIKALANPTNAVCLEYSDLMVALLRSQGIPARMPVGYAYTGTLKQSNSVADSLHSWVEVYVPRVGWINVDPTWDQKFNNFGHSDLDHFAFAIWGQQDNLPAAVMTDDVDQNYQYEQTLVSFRAVAPVAATSGKLTLKQYVLLPFVNLFGWQVTAPSNISGNNYAIELQYGTKSRVVNIGSLAAGQQKAGWLERLTTSFGAVVTARFIQNQDGVPVFGTTQAHVIWWPMWLALAAISGIIALIVLKFRIRRRKHKHVTTKVPSVSIKPPKANDKT